MVRAHVCRVKGLKFESHSMPSLNARSLFTQQRMGTWWQHWGAKGGEERKWPHHMPLAQKSVLSNRHFPKYEIIRNYLYFFIYGNRKIIFSQ